MCLSVKRLPILHGLIILAAAGGLAGCGSHVAPIPSTPVATVGSSPEARALLNRCLDAHGGAAAYARVHDVNVRFDSHWAAVGPKLQPKLSDTGFREGSEERYLTTSKGTFTVGQDHRGPKGEKFVARTPGGVAVWYNGVPSDDAVAKAASALVTDAYSIFVFGPDFFVRRAAALQTLEGGEVNGAACDRLLAVLRPGLGSANEDRVVLSIDRATHVLRRVSFTLNALESTKGAEVHVDLSEQQRLAGVLFPTRFYEHIDRPVSLDAHRWQMHGFDTNRGYKAADIAGPTFKGKASPPAQSR